ncbi:MAG: radical SAM protein [Planctomycetota bacterium]|nr:MAG: radical SAM protein [Planctomycetota bacterium]
MDARSGLPQWTSRQIVAARPSVSRPAPGNRPLGVLWEREAAGDAALADACTVFLRGSECRFRCAMCDLWKSTHWQPTRPGDLPAQIRWALDQPAPDDVSAAAAEGESLRLRWIKLYNAANFFADVNVPRRDLPDIARLVCRFDRVVVENHPKLVERQVLDFRDRLDGRLELAMGLETVHPATLAWLNKGLTVDEFAAACAWLIDHGVDVRTFVLLGLPGMTAAESMDWCRRSVDLARDCGARHISIIPLRAGGGVIDRLEREGKFLPPTAEAVETILEGELGRGAVVTVDLWDFDRLPGQCDACRGLRKRRLERINLGQVFMPGVACPRGCRSAGAQPGHSTE